MKKADWGDGPLVKFKTTDAWPYKYELRKDDAGKAPGHTVIFGPTQGGKIAQMEKIIEKLRGTKGAQFVTFNDDSTR